MIIMIPKAIQIDDRDNVATVSTEVPMGEEVEVLSPDGDIVSKLRTSDAIPFGHKIALSAIEKGTNVVKYGEVIGSATAQIDVGKWVHVHNVESVTVPTIGIGKGEAA